VPMLLDVLLPDRDVESIVQVSLGDDSDKEHIYCECRPNLMFCGRIDPSPMRGFADEIDEEQICRNCRDVAGSSGCPICGCRDFNLCDRCTNA
jgi:hypothetical protein